MASLVRGGALAELTQAFARMGRPSSNRARRGLYAGKDVLFGNMVSHSNRKTRRMFKPNAQRKRVWSDALQEMVPFNLTTTTLRMIDKVGGLDNYLLHTPDHKLDSVSGIEVKRRIAAAMERAAAAQAAGGEGARSVGAGAGGAGGLSGLMKGAMDSAGGGGAGVVG